MRRLVSVFSSKNNGTKSSIRTSQPPSSFPSTPALSPTVPSQSSDASSRRSSLRTPEDEAKTERRTSIKSLKSWLSRKASNLKNDEKVSQPPPRARAAVPPETSDEDEDDDQYDSDEGQSSSSRAHRNLTILLTESLFQHVSSPPLYHTFPSSPFPQSCTQVHAYPSPPTLRHTLLRTRLLQKLRNSSLSLAERSSIIPFGSRDYVPKKAPSMSLFDEVAPNFDRVTVCCRGLQRWIARPCFEDRYVVWTAEGCRPVSGSGFAVLELEYSEALETLAGFGFAEQQDPTVMITVAQETELVHSPLEQPSNGPSPSPPRHSLYVSTPSPLRMQHVPASVPVPPRLDPPDLPPKAVSARAPLPSEPQAATLDVKKGVRFDEDGKDNIPLDFVQRTKKNREEKARFLREEQARRAYDLELARQNAQRARLDKDRLDREAERERERAIWEKERRTWEKEKKAMEEERKAHLYAQELAASRARREASRAGVFDPSSSSSSLSEFGKLHPKLAKSSYSRKEFDSFGRRTGSEANVNTMNSSPRHSATPPSGGSGSPDSSRPPSVATRSRPVSYSSNPGHGVEDTTHSRESSSGSKERASFASLPPGRPPSERSSTLPPSFMFIPPMPQVPMYMLDMPLLPPTPPFMMHQYPRSRSNDYLVRGSSSRPSGSSERVNQVPSSPSRQKGPSSSTSKQNGSKERVNHAPSSPQKSPASSSPHRHSYQSQDRRSTTDTRTGIPQSFSQPNSYSRGRAPVPLAYQAQAQAQAMAMAYQAQFQAAQAAQASSPYMQMPSPWTALPTASQVLSASQGRPSMNSMNGMTANGRATIGHSGGRRQATIS